MSNKNPSPLVLEAIAQLQRLSDVFTRRRAELARRVGLSEQQWRVMEEIATEHFMPSMFANTRDSSPAAVSKVLRQLLDKGLIASSVSASDGRKRKYELTDAGQQCMRELRAHRNRAIDGIWQPIPAQDLKQFNSFAQTLIERIERFTDDEK